MSYEGVDSPPWAARLPVRRDAPAGRAVSRETALTRKCLCIRNWELDDTSSESS